MLAEPADQNTRILEALYGISHNPPTLLAWIEEHIRLNDPVVKKENYLPPKKWVIGRVLQIHLEKIGCCSLTSELKYKCIQI